MPEIGEIRKANEINRVGGGKFMWVACMDCGKERWVQLRRRPESIRCKSCSKVGERAPHWKGGRGRRKAGYIQIWTPRDSFFYPMVDKDGYILEHRLVMAQSLGRNLHRWEIVHHKNHNKEDNRLENLQLVSDDKHKQITILEMKIDRLLQKQDDLVKEVRLLRFENKELQRITNGRENKI